MIASFATIDLLQELETFGPEYAFHQHTTRGGPLVNLCADDDVVGAAPDDLLPFDLVLSDSLLHDIGDEVEVPIIFGFCHEDVADTLLGRVPK
jgi:hypothetical protein